VNKKLFVSRRFFVAKRFKTELTERSEVVGKICSKCIEWKPLEEFSILKNGLGGKHSKCKECKNKSNKKYYEVNKESEHTRRKEYYKKNRKTEIEKSGKRNRDNKEQYSRRLKKWKKDNSNRVNTINQKRRAKKKALPNDWTVEQQEQVLQYFGGCCLTGDLENLHFDHVIPLSSGHGGTIVENMVPLRADLNLSKGDSNLFEWFEDNKERFELSQERFDRLIEYLSEMNGMTPEEYKEYYFWCFCNRVKI
jgi:hypothetical protein